MKFLIINGHKYYSYAKGELNKTLFSFMVEKLSIENEVMTTIVEDGYDVDDEVEKFKRADVIIFQSPVNWFSVTWSLKKYFDDVYKYGVFYAGSETYGDGGLLKNKKYMYSMTCNSPEDAFNNKDSFFDGRSPDDVIFPLHKLQQFCGINPIKSFFCFDVVHNPDIPKYLEELDKHIDKYLLS